MGRFSRKWEASRVSEWRSAYANYAALKAAIYSSADSEGSIFWELLKDERDKVVRFHDSIVLFLREQFSLHDNNPTDDDAFTVRGKRRRQLKEAYRNVNLLRQYRDLNRAALFQVCQKWDRAHFDGDAAYDGAGRAFFRSHIKPVPLFNISHERDVEHLLTRIECEWVRKLNGDLRDLQRIPTRHSTNHESAGLAGFLYGVSSVIAFLFGKEAWIPWLSPLFLAVLFAVSTDWLNRHHINYRFIFCVHERPLSAAQMNAMVATLLFLQVGALLITGRFDWYPGWSLLFTTAVLFLPLPVFWWRSRWWLGRCVLRAVLPLKQITFPDFFLANQLVSLTPALRLILIQESKLAVELSLLLLPSALRVVQCFRRYINSRRRPLHLFNMFKYSTNIVTITCSVLLPGHAWTVMGIGMANQAINFGWDTVMDWGVWEIERGKRKTVLKRREQMFYPFGVYLGMVLFNVGCRLLMCTFPLITVRYSLLGQLTTELARRTVWTVGRLEHEHANNCGALRAFPSQPLLTASIKNEGEDENGELFYQNMITANIDHNNDSNVNDETKSVAVSMAASATSLNAINTVGGNEH